LALKFQYNKVSMQALQKDLNIRLAALPTLKSKEAYLRITIKKEKHRLDDMVSALEARRAALGESVRLFGEFPSETLSVRDVEFGSNNIAGITIPFLGGIDFSESTSLAVSDPTWMPWGWDTLKGLVRSQTEIEVVQRRIALLEHARKKTTQKVNLYEKVQIPEYLMALLKIKRYLEDVENLGKAAQKITKERQALLAESS